MSEILISCPRCDEQTHVAMDQSLTSQRCEKCGLFLYGADTGIKPDPVQRRRRKKKWSSLVSTSASEGKTGDIDTNETYRRSGWQLSYTIMAATTLALVVGLIWWLVSRANKEKGINREPDLVLQTSLQKQAEAPKPVEDAPKFTPNVPDAAWATKARTISEQFLKATTVDEILPLVRHSADVEPSIRAFAAKAGNLPIAKNGVMDLLYAPEENGRSGNLAMLFFQNNENRFQGLVLAETPEGMKVDWPSYSGEGEMTVEKFLELKPTEPVLLRVASRKDDYYNFDFADASQFVCLRLTEFPQKNFFYGYVSTGSALAPKVAHLPSQDHDKTEELQTKPQPLTIKARFRPGSASPNQVEIIDILGNGWFVP